MGSQGALPCNEHSVCCEDFFDPIDKGILVPVIEEALELGHPAQEEPVKDDCAACELH